MRLHLCWGNYEGPHHLDTPLEDIIGIAFKARPCALSFEGANPRHEHEWKVWRDVDLPEGKIIIPGVIDSTSNFVEHPELIADRIADYAQNVAEQLSFRPLFDEPEARANLTRMAEAVASPPRRYEDAVEQLKNVSLSGFARREKDTLHRLIREVNLLEHEADVVERESAAFVCSEGEDNPLAAMHMYRVLQRLDDVANACEMAANAFLPIVLS